ncbi:hypothetical protein GCM10012275_28610 [Longimycelium tulufanense]|uniref:Uncharacterized protein n=1 Tax=Longimycelium tulufanense TaxID=907463 RepID=A0A8J3FW09_9PSEU|nr:hypothetical protein [Longimycelium tulufanense]GGM55785.1 hypothetical protein GCM10012275_28610 [Longimycelium tulufanense]
MNYDCVQLCQSCLGSGVDIHVTPNGVATVNDCPDCDGNGLQRQQETEA